MFSRTPLKVVKSNTHNVSDVDNITVTTGRDEARGKAKGYSPFTVIQIKSVEILLLRHTCIFGLAC